jgi:serine/threonine protein kinase
LSTSTIEPGTRLAGRYRLESRVSEVGGSTLWKAIDEILARAVAVRTFAPDFPHVKEVVTAARAASRLTDPRLTQVFDADDSDELAYVVSEWVSGETLHGMVAARGPLEPGRAATLLYEAAQAIAAGHAAGLAHLWLSPDDLLWTTGGTVKVLGLGVEAALFGVTAENPALMDAQGLGRMLYTALTAHSAQAPEGRADNGALPAAPLADGRLSTPRQLRAGVPEALDAIVCRTLGIGPGITADPISTPAALAEALAGVHRTPLPLFAGLGAHRPATVTRTTPSTIPATAPQAPRPTPPRTAPRPAARQHVSPTPPPPNARTPTTRTPHSAGSAARQPVNRPLIAVAAALATIVVGIGGWQITHMGASGKPVKSSPPASASTAPATSVKLPLTEAFGVDPVGDDGGKAPGKARLAIDGKADTAWRSSFYTSPDFGKLKKGVGLMVDLGSAKTITEVTTDMPISQGASVEIRAGDSKSLDSLKQVASADNVGGGKTSFRLAKPTTVRYVLIWFTKLSAGSDGQLRAEVSEVTVQGQR